MTPPTHPPPLRLGAGRPPLPAVEALLMGSAVAELDAVVVDVEGPGSVTCLQGLLTCDLEARGQRGFSYGAMLTRFGMIVTDLWVARHDAGVRLVVPRAGARALGDVFRKSLPPRLARTTERADLAVLRLVGPRAVAQAEAAGLGIPEPGTADTLPPPVEPLEIAHAPPGAPFVLQIVTSAGGALLERLRSFVVSADGDLLDLARVLAGWPALGHEIDTKTLPQEVRYDDLGGVSYTKGCFVGQETVARVHFRGHPNRGLQGLLFVAEPGDHAAVHLEGRPVGRVTAQVWLPPRRRWLGLAVLRREVEAGSTVEASGVMARVVPLPFAHEMV